MCTTSNCLEHFSGPLSTYGFSSGSAGAADFCTFTYTDTEDNYNILYVNNSANLLTVAAIYSHDDDFNSEYQQGPAMFIPDSRISSVQSVSGAFPINRGASKMKVTFFNLFNTENA